MQTKYIIQAYKQNNNQPTMDMIDIRSTITSNKQTKKKHDLFSPSLKGLLKTPPPKGSKKTFCRSFDLGSCRDLKETIHTDGSWNSQGP